MPIRYRLKLFYDRKIKNLVTLQFLAIIILVLIYSFLGCLIMEDTSLMVVNAGIHEFGHSAGIMLTGSNLTSIQINMNVNSNYTFNSTGSYSHTGVTYDDIYRWIPYIYKISGPLFTLIIAAILVDAPYLRWFAPILGLDNFLQIIPVNVSTDGYGIFQRYGVIVGTFTAILLLLLYLYIVLRLAYYLKNKVDNRDEKQAIKQSSIWDFEDFGSNNK